MTIPSMTQYIKFELYTKRLDGGKMLLATENLLIQFLEMKKMWGQFMWINFYTPCNVNNKFREKMREGLIPGN